MQHLLLNVHSLAMILKSKKKHTKHCILSRGCFLFKIDDFEPLVLHIFTVHRPLISELNKFADRGSSRFTSSSYCLSSFFIITFLTQLVIYNMMNLFVDNGIYEWKRSLGHYINWRALFLSLSLARTHSTVYFPTMRYIEPLHKISTTAITTTADATTEIQFWKHTIRHTHKKRRSKYSRSIIHQTKLNVCTLFAHSKF